MSKERLDKILTDKGFFDTKSRAQAAIMAGDVKVNGIVVTKSGHLLEPQENTRFEIRTMPFVSRGGFKLDKAVKTFSINLQDRICLDAGASTGGFTDCMLQNGAKKVYSVDVGYGQIAWKLRTDSRVKVIEKVNIKNCDAKEIYSQDDEKADFITMDLSFISITKVLPNILKLSDINNFVSQHFTALSEPHVHSPLKVDTHKNIIEIVSLIKPQFEAGREQVGKNGIVREKKTHIEVINKIIEYSKNLNLFVKGLTYSPIKGQKGNIEYLIYLSSVYSENDIDVENTVIEAHN